MISWLVLTRLQQTHTLCCFNKILISILTEERDVKFTHKNSIEFTVKHLLSTLYTKTKKRLEFELIWTYHTFAFAHHWIPMLVWVGKSICRNTHTHTHNSLCARNNLVKPKDTACFDTNTNTFFSKLTKFVINKIIAQVLLR